MNDNIDLDFKETLQEFGYNEHTVKYDIINVLNDNYLPYAMSVIISRALPLLYDGFKPSHRKLLYTMYKMKLLDGKRTKSANIAGQTMRLNPHGDQAIYETMVRLTTDNEALNIPLVDSKGNFGKTYSRDMAYAASRYTEAKLEKVCEEFFNGIDKNIISMIDNYDGTMKEPEILPVSFPNILVNPTQGIAVGMASNICSFNLKEVCDYTINIIKELPNNLLIPDFPTGGKYMYDAKQLEDIKNTGRGNLLVRAKYRYDKKENCIEVTEIPYTTTIEAIMDKVEALVKTKKITEITDMRDESDLSGLKITFDLKKNVNIDLLMQKLYKLTPLQDSFSCNFNMLVGDNSKSYEPKVLGIDEIIKEWLRFRKQCINKSWIYDKQQLEIKLNRLKGLKIIIDDLDTVVNIIRKSKTKKDSAPNLMEYYKLTQEQAEYIVSFKLNDLNENDLQLKINEYESIKKEIETLKNKIDNDNELNNEICIQLEQISKKYSKPRKTEILYNDDTEIKITKADTIEDYNCNIVLTKEGYIKKTRKESENQKLKDGDIVLQQIKSTNKSKLLLFTDKYNMYTINTYDIDDCLPSNLGTYTKSLLNLQDENVIYVTSTIDYSGYMLISFKEGYAVKVPLSSYKTTYKKLSNAYSSKFTLLNIMYISNDIDICCKTSDSYYMTFNTSLMNSKDSRKSQGVRIIRIKNGYMNLFQENHLSEVETKACWYDKKLDVTGKKLDI